MTNAEKKYIQMTSAPPGPVILRLAAPMVVCMLVTGLYNMADTFFVGQLGKSATGAVGVAYPVMNMITAIGYCFGNGGGVCLSNFLGARQRGRASQAASTSLILCFCLMLLVGLLGLAMVNTLVFALGATDTIAPRAADYLRFIFAGMAFAASAAVLSNVLRYQGSPALAMAGTLAGGLLNIALDPLFIFALDMGVAGAALATVISQCVSFALLLTLCLRSGVVELRPRHLCLRAELILRILKLGMPTFLRQFLTSLSAVVLNFAAKPFGDGAIAAMTIVSKIVFFFQAYSMGFGQGFQPFCGYNYGARLYRRVYSGFRFFAFSCAVSMAGLAAAGFALASPLAGLFSDDAQVVEMAAQALRCQLPVVPISAVTICFDIACQTMGQVKKVMALSLLRQGLFLSSFALILPRLLDFTGVQLAQPCAEVVSFLCAAAMFLPSIRRLRDLESPSPPPDAD